MVVVRQWTDKATYSGVGRGRRGRGTVSQWTKVVYLNEAHTVLGTEPRWGAVFETERGMASFERCLEMTLSRDTTGGEKRDVA